VAGVRALLGRLDTVLGFLAAPEAAADDHVMALVRERQQARADRDFQEADRIRDVLASEGWEVRDSPDGPVVKRRQS
jgi:cysteinyl-tRNA synthetase